MLDPVILGELIRHLQEWQSLYEAEGIDTLTGPGGDVYCLADLLRLHELSRHLPPLQAMAIQCLYLDKTDADAARLMRTDGVAGHAQAGLVALCALFEDTPREGRHDGYAGDDASWAALAPGEAAAAERGVPGPGGLCGRPDRGLAEGRDLALCQV